MSQSTELRPDLQVIARMVEPESLVLDIGFGKGELLHWLNAHKQVDARGIDRNQERVSQAIARGLSVVHGDVNTDLSHYPDHAYDYVISSQTLQAMKDPKATLAELCRVGKKVIVSVPNFGYWRNRLYLGLKGRMPVTDKLTYQWYETPNIHFCTLTDFRELCDLMELPVLQQVAMMPGGQPHAYSGKSRRVNLLGELGVFLLEKG